MCATIPRSRPYRAHPTATQDSAPPPALPPRYRDLGIPHGAPGDVSTRPDISARQRRNTTNRDPVLPAVRTPCPAAGLSLCSGTRTADTRYPHCALWDLLLNGPSWRSQKYQLRALWRECERSYSGYFISESQSVAGPESANTAMTSSTSVPSPASAAAAASAAAWTNRVRSQSSNTYSGCSAKWSSSVRASGPRLSAAAGSGVLSLSFNLICVALCLSGDGSAAGTPRP